MRHGQGHKNLQLVGIDMRCAEITKQFTVCRFGRHDTVESCWFGSGLLTETLVKWRSCGKAGAKGSPEARRRTDAGICRVEMAESIFTFS